MTNEVNNALRAFANTILALTNPIVNDDAYRPDAVMDMNDIGHMYVDVGCSGRLLDEHIDAIFEPRVFAFIQQMMFVQLGQASTSTVSPSMNETRMKQVNDLTSSLLRGLSTPESVGEVLDSLLGAYNDQ